MRKLNWMTKAYGVFLLWAMAAVALPAQTFTSLFSFDGRDGHYPAVGMVQGANGNIYGTTGGGGSNSIGTVFKITTSGALATLHSFAGTDGSTPEGGLIQTTDGKFYGTTIYGGANNDGTVFKITLGGRITPLHSFDGTDGELPSAALIQGTDGNFYGTTYTGGANSVGTVFKITPSGTLTTLHSFAGYPTDGSLPLAGLIQGTSGTFYGTTDQGGAIGAGTVFSLSVGLGPFAEIEPTFGPVGAAVTILGTNLTGTTSVTFSSLLKNTV